jgi:SulP family sulfate permease
MLSKLYKMVLAVIIFMSQIEQFKVMDLVDRSVWLTGNALYIMIALIVITMAVVLFFQGL